MSEHPELSRLPADEQYWERLEARILADLEVGAPSPVESAEWWAPLAQRAYLMGAAAVAAVLAAVVLLPGAPTAPRSPAGLLQPPAEDLALINPLLADAPPSLGQLLLPDSRRNSR